MAITYVLTVIVRHTPDARSSNCHAHIQSVHTDDDDISVLNLYKKETEYLWDEDHRPSIGSFTKGVLNEFYSASEQSGH